MVKFYLLFLVVPKIVGIFAPVKQSSKTQKFERGSGLSTVQRLDTAKIVNFPSLSKGKELKLLKINHEMLFR